MFMSEADAALESAAPSSGVSAFAVSPLDVSSPALPVLSPGPPSEPHAAKDKTMAEAKISDNAFFFIRLSSLGWLSHPAMLFF
jgi:hypothetical protein